MTENKSANQKPGSNVLAAMRRTLGLSIPATMVVSATLAMAFAIALDGCSKHEGKSTNASSAQSIPQPVASVPAALPSPSPTPAKVAEKKPAVKKAPTIKYHDKGSGVSFRYPGYFVPVTPDKNDASGEDSVPANFAQPGGVMLTEIKLPNSTSSSIFKVSLNKGVTADQCNQFAVPEAGDVKNNPPADLGDGSLPSKQTIHGVEFFRVENATENSDVKYYHRYVPGQDSASGTCYEFALGVEELPDNFKDLDYGMLFDRLERIFATVKIQPEPATAVTASVPASTSGTNPQ